MSKLSLLRIAQDPLLVGNSLFTDRVKELLQEDVLTILDFCHEWRHWLAKHPEHLPEKEGLIFYHNNFCKSSINNLHWRLLSYLRQHSNLNKDQVEVVFHLLIDIFNEQYNNGIFPIAHNPLTNEILTLNNVDEFTSYIKTMIPPHYLELLLSE